MSAPHDPVHWAAHGQPTPQLGRSARVSLGVRPGDGVGKDAKGQAWGCFAVWSRVVSLWAGWCGTILELLIIEVNLLCTCQERKQRTRNRGQETARHGDGESRCT